MKPANRLLPGWNYGTRIFLWKASKRKMGRLVPTRTSFNGSCSIPTGPMKMVGIMSTGFPVSTFFASAKARNGKSWDIPITIRKMKRADGSDYRELDGQRKDVALKRLYDLQAKGWFPGDAHHHSWHSDGRNTPHAVYISALASGLSWAALTDHNTVEGNPVWVECTNDKFLAVPGFEVTTGNKEEANAKHKGWGHQNVLGTNKLPGAKDAENPIIWDRYIYNTWEDVQNSIDETHADGALFMINHSMQPGNWFGGACSTWGQIKNYDAIEVWNAYDGNVPFTPWIQRLENPDKNVWNQHTVTFQVWFEFLNAGNRLAGWASSDCHDATGLMQGGVAPTRHRGITGFATTYVKADGLSWPNIREGLKKRTRLPDRRNPSARSC